MFVKPTRVNLIDNCKSISRDSLNEFLEILINYHPELIRKPDEIPVYQLASNEYDHLTYFFLHFFGPFLPDMTFLLFDKHDDTALFRKGFNGKFTSKSLNIEYKGECDTDAEYEKLDFPMNCTNYVRDILELPLKNAFWITEQNGVNRLCELKFRKGNEHYKLSLRQIQTGNMVELTKRVANNNGMIYVHYDPDIHPTEIINTGYTCGNVSRKEMYLALYHLFHDRKLIGMTVSTQNPKITDMLKDLYLEAIID